jgi:hypothetical protein
MSNLTVITVHGFAERSGRDTTDKLTPYFERVGVRCVEFDYGFKLFVSFRNDGWALRLGRLADEQEGDVALLGFSNGGDVAIRTSYLSERIKRLVLVRPAAKCDVEVAAQIERVTVFYSPHDGALLIAPLVEMLNPFSRWGRLGRDGYTGSDKRFVNINTAHGHEVKSLDHLDIWEDEKLRYFGPMMVAAATGGHA